MKEVKLPSGATLKIQLSPFADSKALWQALLYEARGLQLDALRDVTAMYKTFFCVGFSSPLIEVKLWECFKRCIYVSPTGDERKVDADTFNPAEARQDYIMACVEVARENTEPFMKGLYAEFLQGIKTLENIQA